MWKCVMKNSESMKWRYWRRRRRRKFNEEEVMWNERKLMWNSNVVM